jgi:DNA-directed RNA polymerase subunit RPC12/RpoP
MMKFVCMKCEAFMLFQKVEQPGDDSLGVTFECPQCGSRFAMVTNPGETQMVSALGVKLGGRTEAPQPFELTRGTLKEPIEAISQTGAVAAAALSSVAESAGKCPFSSMVTSMKEGKPVESEWSAEALERMEKIPEFVRNDVRAGIEAFAQGKGYRVITPAVIEESKSDISGILWTDDAESRLKNVPFFIRPMVRREIERMVREMGSDRVTAGMMDEARKKFDKFMGG